MTQTDPRDTRTHFRGKARPGRRVELTYQLADQPSAEPIEAFTRNVGVGGAFIVTDRPARVGATLRLVIHVPTSETMLDVTAEVRWSSPESGMGVKFHDLDVDQLLLLSEYFASLTGSDSAL